MSVTFSIESNPTGKFIAECYPNGIVARADDYEGVLAAIAAHKAVCEECAHYGLHAQSLMDVSGDLDLNVSNANARHLLTLLGLPVEDDLCGMVDAKTFLGAVMLAMASDRDDTGVRPLTTGGPGTGKPTWVDCGLPAGYFANRFGALHALASEAVRLGRPVVWS